MKRRGFLKVLGGAAAVPLVAKAGIPEVVDPTDSPLERMQLALQRQIMDNIYLASYPLVIVSHTGSFGDEQHAANIIQGTRRVKAEIEYSVLRSQYRYRVID